jgi:hypothetical protein
VKGSLSDTFRAFLFNKEFIMQIHHVFCLAPHIASGKTVNLFHFSDTEKRVQILSVAVFKQNHPNTTFKLYADSVGFAFLESIGLTKLYDSVNTSVLDSMPQSFNHAKFWAGSKIFAYQDALKTVQNPIFIDIDAILWRALNTFSFAGDVIAAHYEAYNLNHSMRLFPNNDCDAASTLFQKQPFQLNASFLWFRRNPSVWLAYCEKAIRYMVNHPEPVDLPIWAAMCYAEQVLLLDHAGQSLMLTEALGKMDDPQFTKYYTHLWAMKGILRTDAIKDITEARNCDSVIRKYFPAYTRIAEKC